MGPDADDGGGPAGTPVPGGPASQRALRSQGRRTMRKLLDAAMEVFTTRGYHATRVDDIVRAARTSHGTFYLYFSNKEELLRALAAEAGEVVTALDVALGPVGPDDSGWHELRAWMGRFSEAWQRYAPVLRAWTDLVVTDAQMAEQAHVAAGGAMATLADRMEKAGPLPGIDPVAAAEAVVAMVDRFHYLRQFADEPVDESALDTLTTIVHRGLFGGGDPPSRRRRRGARPAAGAAAASRTAATTTATRAAPTRRAATRTATTRKAPTPAATTRTATTRKAPTPAAPTQGATTRTGATRKAPTRATATRTAPPPAAPGRTRAPR